MSEQSEKVLTEAMKLPTEERARVAMELIASVDGEPEPDAEVAWGKEIDRRVQRIKSDGPKGDDWVAAHDRIAARLRSK